MLEKFIKTYAGDYKYTTMIRHKGVVIAFALDDNRRIWYTILNLGGGSQDLGKMGQPQSILDVDAWLDSPKELIFPNEIAEVGFGVADQTALPVFKKVATTPIPEVEGTALPPGRPNEYDYFRSTTARFTEKDVPFEVLSDGSYVYVFRQAIADADFDSMVFVDSNGKILVYKVENGRKTLGNVQHHKQLDNQQLAIDQWIDWTKPTDDERDPVPLVNSTLLVDRFVLVGTELTPKMEVRYQRSRSRTRPASRKDSLGPKDLDGNFFYEPTQELRFVGNLTGGHFSILLLPTAIADVKRWQIFAENRITGRMDSYNVERSQDGLFNTRGSQTYTCSAHPQVYAKQVGKCTESECGNSLIPRIVDKGYSESAMKFDGLDDYVSLGEGVKVGTSFTQEAWIMPTATDENYRGFLGNQPDELSNTRSPSLWTVGKKLHAGFGDGTYWNSLLTQKDVLTLNTWNHVAVTFNGSEYKVYVNGESKAYDVSISEPNPNDLTPVKTFAGKVPYASSIKYIGKVDNYFQGVIDEIRIWNRARARQEILEDMHHRLTGLEPDLVGYWRFDEGYGYTIHDQTNNKMDGTSYYDENKKTYQDIKWTQSDAPVGEHPGVERTSFEIKGRSFKSAPASLLYYQQSKVPSGYSGEAKLLKNTGRVMLAVATKKDLGDTDLFTVGEAPKYHIVALDFGVSATGRLAQVTDEVELAWVNAKDSKEQSLNDDLDRLGNLQTELLSLDEVISRTEAIERVAAILEKSLQDPAACTDQITNAEFSYLNENLMAFRQANQQVSNLTISKQLLETQLANASMTVFADESYRGESLGPFRSGYIQYSYLYSQGFNDKIFSIQLRGPIEVVVYEDDNRGGAQALFSDSVDSLDPLWRNRISCMDVREKDDFQRQRIDTEDQLTAALRILVQARSPIEQELENLTVRLDSLKPEKPARVARRVTLQSALVQVWDKVKNGASAMMPCLHTDPLGLTVSGGLLGFAWTDDAPLLFDSATGKLALYFRGRDKQFFVAYYDTFTERPSIQLDNVTCFARSTDYPTVTIHISDGPDPDVCTVEITNAENGKLGDIVETWEKVPRRPAEFARVLNGQATGHTFIGSGAKKSDANGPFIALDEVGARRAIHSGSTLMVGDKRITAKTQVFPGSDKIYYEESGCLPDEILPVFFVEYDYAEDASSAGLPVELSNGSTLLRALPVGNPDALISNQPGRELVPTLVCRWTAATPGSTLAFDGATQFAEISDIKKLHDFDAATDLTLETWVRPTDIGGTQRILQHHSGDSQYTLALVGHQSAFGFDGAEDYISILHSDVLNVSGAITIEAWIRPEAIDGTRNIVAHGYPYTDTGELILRMEDDHYEIGVWKLGNYLARIPIPREDGNGSTWVHLAGVYDDMSKQWILYRNGIAGVPHRTEKGPYLINADWGIAANAHPDLNAARRLFKGAIDDVRIWKSARTQQEIQKDMNRQLNGDEPDLIGYWHFESREVQDYSRSQNHGTIHGEPALLPSHIVNVVAGVGGKFVQPCTILPVGSWAHLAAVYERAYCVAFDGTDGFLDCGNAEPLNISGDITIEVSFQVDDLTRNQGILSRGKLNWPGQKVPYAISLDTEGRIEFTFEDVDGNPYTYKSDESVRHGKGEFNRVMVTRKRQTETETIPGDPPSYITRVHHDISLYINSGVPKVHAFTGGERLSPPDIGRSDMSLEIGRASAEPFKGAITEVRIWNLARASSQFGAAITGQENGLVSWWRFKERKGKTTNDSVSTNHAELKGNVEWVVNTNSPDSSLMIHINGEDQINRLSEPNKLVQETVATSQFTLGAWKNDDTFDQCFQGELEEVRIWQTARTVEQIQDNLFKRIQDEKEDLIAYYTFDMETGNTVSDYSLRGNHLTLKAGASYVISTAPIGEDTPQVRSALAGIRTLFSGMIESTPAVQEYADRQYDSRGNLIGAFKRCYSFLLDGKWRIITGYKVGDMLTEWIGQVQFAPELIGFIEGAPPVPGENLAVDGLGTGGDYNEASSVELVEADNTTNTYASSRDTGFDMSVGFKLGFMIGTEANVGFGLVVKSVDVENIIGLHAQFDHSLGWLDSASTATSMTTSKSTALALRGRAASYGEAEKEKRARRFMPENTGMALVKSETADVFALRLRHNGALIAYQMSPNPDIPKDWNIIHFPINPRYTKQGTLDGKIGLSPDNDYPSALTYSSNSSYFKPIEAYALKDRIKREERQLQARYDEYDAGSIGRRQKALHFSEGDLAAGRMLDKLPNLHKHNLINTYVWTADGGMFAETEETMDSRQETIGGSYAFKGMAGLYTDLTLALFSIGAKFEADAMFGGHLNLNVTKTRQSSSSFQMKVGLDKVERDIYLRDKDGSIILDIQDSTHPKPLREPGKVDAYRFMSFYLEPLADHFDDFFNLVVDPAWLEQSDEPGAVALREAREGNQQNKPAPWRVMHRVTYVSRVLPPLDLSAPPSLEKTLQTLDIDSNYELIKLLEPYVRDKLANFAEFSTAVDDALGNYLPELIPHKKEIKEYLSLYFGIDQGYMLDSQVEGFGEDTEYRQAPNKPPFVNAGQVYAAVLPDENNKFHLEPTKAIVSDTRTTNTEDLFLTWEFIPGKKQQPEDVKFWDSNVLDKRTIDPHRLQPIATFLKKGVYRLRLTASDGMLSASDETLIVVNEAPAIKGITAGKPERRLEKGEPCWDVELTCTIGSGLGRPSQLEAGNLSTTWKVLSGSQKTTFEIGELNWKEPPDELEIKTHATFHQSGHYMLEFTFGVRASENKALETTSQINLEIAARVTEGLQALYTFEGQDAIVHDVSGAEVSMDLIASKPEAMKWSPGGLALQSSGILSAKAYRLTKMIQENNSISIEAWIKPPESYMQETHPRLRRILTLSDGPSARNFILAQRGKAYHVGLRTTDGSVTDANASLKSLEVDVVDSELTQVVFIRNRNGDATLYKNGEPISNRSICGDFSQWDENFQLALGNEFKSNGIHDRPWSGEYHLVAIYSRALSPEEVKQNYEFGADRDLPPQVFAGEDRTVNWSLEGVEKEKGTSLTVRMAGRVIHDRPNANGYTKWEKAPWEKAPNDKLTFVNSANPETEVNFSESGIYRLRLTASDGEQVVSRHVTITVLHEVPIVRITNADTKLIVTRDGVNVITLKDGKASLILNGAVRNSRGDDYPRGKLAVEWTCDPDHVTFDDVHKIDPVVTFTKNGVYVLTLTARNTDESDKAASDTVVITVNEAPVVDAGPDQVIILPHEAILDASVSDDGLPDHPGILDLTWTATSKGVIFEQPKADYTGASFSDKGTYALKLSAFDGAAVSEDEVTVIVNKAPVIDAGQDATVKFNEQIALIGIIEDDGFGNESQKKPIDVLWEMESGPEQPVFTNPNKLEARVKFLKKGIYRLKVTASTDYGRGSDTIRFTVNQPPQISAGKDQTVSRKESIELKGQIIDNGLGDPERDQDKLSIEWEGPDGFTLANKSSLETTVTIPKGNQKSKTCEFQLTVTNPSFAASETVTVKLE